MKTATAIALTAVLLAGCSAEDGPEPAPEETPAEQAAYSQECGDAVAQAAEVGDMEDTVEDLDPAIVACDSVEELQAAADDHPTALEDTDAATWASNRCQFSEDQAVKDSAICDELGA